jgi:acyl-CoA synthetase (AMP-forming)/AMP-acid ligase II
MALCLENSQHYYEIVWGAQRSGLYYTAASTRLTAGELEYILNDCGARVFVTSHALAPLAELPVLEIVSGTHIIADLTLELGKVVHDYLA